MCRLPTKLPQPKQHGQMCQKYRQQRHRITRTRRRPQAAVQRNQSADCQQNRQIQRIRRRCNGAREKLHERGKGKPHERRRQQMHIIAAGRLRINPSAVRRTQNWQRARHLPQENACRHIGKRTEKKDFCHVMLLYVFCTSLQAFTLNGSAISSTTSFSKPIFQPGWTFKYTEI